MDLQRHVYVYARIHMCVCVCVTVAVVLFLQFMGFSDGVVLHHAASLSQGTWNKSF